VYKISIKNTLKVIINSYEKIFKFLLLILLVLPLYQINADSQVNVSVGRYDKSDTNYWISSDTWISANNFWKVIDGNSEYVTGPEWINATEAYIMFGDDGEEYVWGAYTATESSSADGWTQNPGRSLQWSDVVLWFSEDEYYTFDKSNIWMQPAWIGEFDEIEDNDTDERDYDVVGPKGRQELGEDDISMSWNDNYFVDLIVLETEDGDQVLTVHAKKVYSDEPITDGEYSLMDRYDIRTLESYTDDGEDYRLHLTGPNGVDFYSDTFTIYHQDDDINLGDELNLTPSNSPIKSGSHLSFTFNDVGADYYELTADCERGQQISGKARVDICEEAERITVNSSNYLPGKEIVQVKDFYPRSEEDESAQIILKAYVNGRVYLEDTAKLRINADDGSDELSNQEILDLVAVMFGKDSDAYKTVKLLLDLGVIGSGSGSGSEKTIKINNELIGEYWLNQSRYERQRISITTNDDEVERFDVTFYCPSNIGEELNIKGGGSCGEVYGIGADSSEATLIDVGFERLDLRHATIRVKVESYDSMNSFRMNKLDEAIFEFTMAAG
jgi:hypothetical protein